MILKKCGAFFSKTIFRLIGPKSPEEKDALLRQAVKN